MNYYFTRTVSMTFGEAIEKTTQALHAEGFGVLTDIDMKATLKKKLGAEFRNYRILGACNPPSAYQALQLEDKAGLLLPCNVVLQEVQRDTVEISAINPVEAMKMVANDALHKVAEQVGEKLQKVLQAIQ